MRNQTNEVSLRFLAEPTDANVFGNVHGGSVMKWIDQAAYACASGWSGLPCVTVYVGGIRFFKPIHINELVQVHARLIFTNVSSMHIAVDVSASDPKEGIYNKTTHCVTIFVAMDEHWQPVPVARWTPRTEEEVALEVYAKKLMDLRRGIEKEMQQYLFN